MLIREQGYLIKLMRLERSPGTRRNRHTVIGVFRANEEVPPQLLDTLDAEERTTLERWLAAWQQAQGLTRTHPALAQHSSSSSPSRPHSTLPQTLSSDEADRLWRQCGTSVQNLLCTADAPPAREHDSAPPLLERDSAEPFARSESDLDIVTHSKT